MYTYVISLAYRISIYVTLGRIYHKVQIKRNIRFLFQLFNKASSQGNIGNKASIHNVNVQNIYLLMFEHFYLLPHVKKVATHHGRC